MTSIEIMAILDHLPAAQPPGLAILLELEQVERFEEADSEVLAELVERQQEIVKAISDLQKYTDQVAEVIRRCLRLSPVAATHLPPGF